MNNKIALISDIHFGVKGNSETFLSIIEKFFLETLNEVTYLHNITDVRILGDLFDHRNNVNVRTFNVVLDIFSWYEKNRPKIHFKILLGNHDIYFKNTLKVNSVNILSRFKNVTLISVITEEIIGDKKVISYPWIIDGTAIGNTFKAHCVGKNKWDLCLGHFEIRGFEMTRGNPDITGIEQGQFKNYGRVFSGHYHLRHTNNHISYLGCPYEITWNDYDDEKGIHIYDADTGKTDFIANVDSPKHIKVNAEDILNSSSKFLKGLSNNTIKLIINKKFKDSEINSINNKLESIELIKIDTENNYIDEDVEADDVDISNLSNPLLFLREYLNDLTLEEDIDIEEAKKRIDAIHYRVEEG